MSVAKPPPRKRVRLVAAWSLGHEPPSEEGAHDGVDDIDDSPECPECKASTSSSNSGSRSEEASDGDESVHGDGEGLVEDGGHQGDA